MLSQGNFLSSNGSFILTEVCTPANDISKINQQTINPLTQVLNGNVSGGLKIHFLQDPNNKMIQKKMILSFLFFNI